MISVCTRCSSLLMTISWLRSLAVSPRDEILAWSALVNIIPVSYFFSFAICVHLSTYQTELCMNTAYRAPVWCYAEEAAKIELV